MSSSVTIPTISVTIPDEKKSEDDISPATRASASAHKDLMAVLRPMPFQYIWALHYDKAAIKANTNTSNYNSRLSVLDESIPDIAEFYKAFNNFPWSRVPVRDTVHLFRLGVQPLWEDEANLAGGSWTIKVRKAGGDKPAKVWEEMCLLSCGGELQAAIVEEGVRDSVLGLSFAPKGLWVCVSVWLKNGEGRKVLEDTVLERLSPGLKPGVTFEYFWKKHSDHEGWEEAVGKKK